ncbi:helix-turn-helix domain-containing protein [Rhizobium tubonense]|uniref:AraC family transcriptional regulator n=1 Tax=Rhizobium tubonense TaxID=484088 RepID=A0A2W4C9F6_9HYPH|nr:AraC family transcriptional regulator [Rhizobium tubonense]PZM08008.1 AraC family transcriptional regulator [Rhizobium tubonense]
MSDAVITIRNDDRAGLLVDEINLHDFSGEVSKLLLMAINCIEDDEAVAIDHMKRASKLLRPNGPKDGSGLNSGGNTKVASGGLASWQVRRIKAYVAEQIAGQISLNDLAELVSLSTSYFSSAFKASFGVSPHNYVVAQRVEFAKKRMLFSDTPLCEIALDCGLADQAHLSRVFRRVTGMTPSAWRRYSLRTTDSRTPKFSGHDFTGDHSHFAHGPRAVSLSIAL